MVKNDLNRPITAHFIRFIPVEWNYKPCMRVEVYGTAIGKVKTYALPPKEIMLDYSLAVLFFYCKTKGSTVRGLGTED